jgi:glycosyltransferase involved in cell wall biosynthesis
MRVLIITAMYPPNRTGTSYYSKCLAETFVRNGFKIILITTTNKEVSDNEMNNSFNVIRIPALHIPLKNYFKHLRFCSFNPQNYIRIKNISKSFNPDIILLINHYLDIAFPAIYASRLLNIPLYISIGTQLQSLNSFRNKVLHFLDRLIVGNFIFPFATRIVSWDHEIERYINDVHRKSNAEKSIMIPFGVNGDISHYNVFENNYEDSKQILGVGAVIDHRNYVYQIKVFKEILKIYPDLTFKIVGNKYIEEPEKVARELGIRDKVIFTGEIPHEEVLKEYQKSLLHWMMLCGKYVGLGMATIEAMLMGVPVISNVPENLLGDNKLRDMHNYVYTDGKTINKDVDNICKIIYDKQLRKVIGKNGKEFVQKYLNWDSVAEQFKHIIQEDTKVE